MSFKAIQSIICCLLLQVLTGVQRKVKTEAVATCVYLHHKSTSTPQSTPVFVLRDRSWQLTVYAAGLVSHGAKLFYLYIFFFLSYYLSLCALIAHICKSQVAYSKLLIIFFLYMYNFRALWLRHREMVEKRGCVSVSVVFYPVIPPLLHLLWCFSLLNHNQKDKTKRSLV